MDIWLDKYEIAKFTTITNWFDMILFLEIVSLNAMYYMKSEVVKADLKGIRSDICIFLLLLDYIRQIKQFYQYIYIWFEIKLYPFAVLLLNSIEASFDTTLTMQFFTGCQLHIFKVLCLNWKIEDRKGYIQFLFSALLFLQPTMEFGAAILIKIWNFAAWSNFLELHTTNKFAKNFPCCATYFRYMNFQWIFRAMKSWTCVEDYNFLFTIYLNIRPKRHFIGRTEESNTFCVTFSLVWTFRGLTVLVIYSRIWN